MSVYGDQIAFFPELFRRFQITEHEPSINNGLVEKATEAQTVSGILTTLKDSVLQTDSMTYVTVERRVFFTRVKLDGRFQFLSRVSEEVLFRLSKSKDFTHEGGFFCYTLESVAGLTEKVPDTPNVRDVRSQY